MVRKIFLTILVFVLIYFAVDPVKEVIPFCVRVNITESLPQHLFLGRNFKDLSRNSFVVFEHQTTPVPLLKQVVGVPGDPIELREGHVYVNDFDYGEVLSCTRSGCPIHPIQQKEVPAGYVYVHAPHPQSFDSRYEEFGLIPVEEIEEELWPLF